MRPIGQFSALSAAEFRQEFHDVMPTYFATRGCR